MRKLKHILKETLYLIREHKLYFISPLLIFLCILAITFFQLGQSILLAFIYSGI
jgi:hypothetical protein